MGSGAVTGADAVTSSVMGPGPGAGTGIGGGKPGNGADTGTSGGERPGNGPDPGTGEGERPGKGADTGAGTGAADQDACRARPGTGGALFWGGAVFGGGFARLAVAVPEGPADRAAGPRRCFPPSNESPPGPAAGSLAPRRR